MKLCPKDRWIIDYVSNFIEEDDLQISAINRLASIKDSVKRIAEVTKMSANDKNSIIQHSELNLSAI